MNFARSEPAAIWMIYLNLRTASQDLDKLVTPWLYRLLTMDLKLPPLTGSRTQIHRIFISEIYFSISHS